MQEEPRLIDFARSDNHRLLLSGAVAFFCVQSALAQAWLAPQGEASFAVVYGNVYTHDHLFSEGERFDRGSVRMNVAVFGLSYSFTDRLAASAAWAGQVAAILSVMLERGMSAAVTAEAGGPKGAAGTK